MIQSILILSHSSSGLDLTKDHFRNIEGLIAYYYKTLYFVCLPHHAPTKWHLGITFNSKTTFFLVEFCYQLFPSLSGQLIISSDYISNYILPCVALCLISSYFFSSSLLPFIKTFFNFTPPTRFYLKQPYFISSHLECEWKLQTWPDPVLKPQGFLSFCQVCDHPTTILPVQYFPCLPGRMEQEDINRFFFLR